jgi:hypothetical protein
VGKALDPDEVRAFVANVDKYKRQHKCNDREAAERLGVDPGTVWRRRHYLRELEDEEAGKAGRAAREAETNGREVDEDALRKEASVTVRRRCDKLEARIKELEAEVVRLTPENNSMWEENHRLRRFVSDVTVNAVARDEITAAEFQRKEVN